jgi:hypothetical protein
MFLTTGKLPTLSIAIVPIFVTQSTQHVFHILSKYVIYLVAAINLATGPPWQRYHFVFCETKKCTIFFCLYLIDFNLWSVLH